MESSPSPQRLVAEEFRKLIYKRNFMMSRIDKAHNENQSINSAVINWLDEVEELIKEKEKTHEWSSKMTEKIKSLHGKSNFDPFYITSENHTPQGKVDPEEGSRDPRIMVSKPGLKINRHKTYPRVAESSSESIRPSVGPTSTGFKARTFLSPFAQRSSNPTQTNPIQTSTVKSTSFCPEPMRPIPNPRVESTSSWKSRKEDSNSELEGDTNSHASGVKSIPAPRAETIISSAKFSVSSSSIEEAGSQKGDTVQGLQTQLSSGGFMYLGSTNQAKNDLLKELQDDRYHTIGLFGERGCGKTKLVDIQIPEYEKIFDIVVFVTVSKIADITKLQEDIAPQLSLKLKARDEFDRASIIESTLKKKDKVLVIFDDVRTEFNPRNIGIPHRSKRCKILLITHDKQYSNMMGCQTWIHLPTLSKEDAWKLLQQYSGIDHHSRGNLFKVAREVAFLCKGLPRVIEDVVTSIRNKKSEDHKEVEKFWTESLDCLKHETAQYHIFISFRGTDTRDHFAESLYGELVDVGLKVFIDRQLRSGDKITTLFEKIDQSLCSVIILSQNYAQSYWCLEELAKIMKCKDDNKQLVYPIFFNVSPADVRYQKGSFELAMDKQEKRYGKDKVKEWTSALDAVAGLSGQPYTSGYHKEFIQTTVVKYVQDNKHRLHII